MSQRIWIDMTDLDIWSGHMTGVQRVVYQNAKRFAEAKDYEAHFFSFNDVHKIFVEVSFDEISSRIEAAAGEAHANQDNQPRSLKQRLKNAPRAIVRRMPASVKKHVPSIVKRGLRKGARVGVGALRHAKRSAGQFAHQAPQLEAVTFEKNDVVLLMGKTWDLPDLIPALGRLKQKHGFNIVHLVHDLIPVFEVQLFGPGLFEPYTSNMFEICSLSDGILTNSVSTKRDVERFCREMNIAKPPIKAVRLGDDLLNIELSEDEPAPDPRIKKGEFIAQVGTIEVRKNHQLVYMAYREAALRGIKLPTWVVMGSPGWLTGDVIWQMEHDPLVKDNIVILRGFPDRARLWLYLNCRFTVWPSTYEGWGMPVSESMAYGKVCITSNQSSMPEIGGDLADYVSPYNSQQMLEKLVEYTDNAKLAKREKQIRSGYKLTSWDDTYKQVESFIRTVS